MANNPIDLGNGQTVVPDWAKESTLLKLVEVLSGKKGKEQQARTEKALRNLADGLDDHSEDLKEVSSSLDGMGERIGESIAGTIGTVIDKSVGLALIVLGTAVTTITASFMKLGGSLNSLSQSGLALEGGTVKQIASLNELGMSTDAATDMMLNNAQVFRTLGNVATTQVLQSFLDVTKSGNNLGLSLEDAGSFIADELKLRTQLLNLGNLDARQQQKMAQDVAQLGRTQLKYSKALGVSTDAQREFTEAALANNTMLMANMIRTSSASRAELVTGAQSFLSGMRAMGGEVGGEIGVAVLEAASMGAVGFSDAAFGFITVLPGLADNMQSVIEDFNNGLINGEEAAMSFTNELGNLSDGERSRVFLLARAGDEQAKAMAKAIIQFEQSAAKMKEQGLEIENVQTGFNALNTIVAKVKGMFSSVINTFMSGFGKGLDDTTNLLNNLATGFQKIVLTLFGLDSGAGSTTKKIEQFGIDMGKNLDTIIKKVVSFIQGYVEGLAGLSFKEKIGKILYDMGVALVEGIASAINWGKVTLAIGVAFAAAIAAVKLGAIISAGIASMIGLGGGTAAAGTVVAGTVAKTGVMAGMAAGLAAFGNPVVAAGVAVVTLAIVALAGAFALASLGFEAFGKMMKDILSGAAPVVESFGVAIKSVFEGIGSVITSVGDSISGIVESVGKVIEKYGEMKVGRITAEADAMVKTTQATTTAIEQLSGKDPQQLVALAGGIQVLSDSLASFTETMSPGVLDSLKSGVLGLFGADSPIEQVIGFSQEADPVKIMDLAKATMAATAAQGGATTLDPSLSTTNNNTTINNANAPVQTNSAATSEALAPYFEAQLVKFNELLLAQKKSNTLLTTIRDKT